VLPRLAGRGKRPLGEELLDRDAGQLGLGQCLYNGIPVGRRVGNGRRRPGQLLPEAAVPQDLLDDGLLRRLDEGDHFHRRPALGARERVHLVDPLDQLGPGEVDGCYGREKAWPPDGTGAIVLAATSGDGAAGLER
jgi:hypothetical protein